jgi:hypothetical protein
LVAGGVAAEDGDGAGESSGGDPPREGPEQAADVLRVDRTGGRVPEVVAAPGGVHDDVAAGGQRCGD